MEQKELSMTQQAVSYIRDQIQNCELMPGEPLSEKKLCQEIGCGRTPVREALLSLQSEGLVEIFPRRGIQVTPFTREAIWEIYQIRKIIEPTICGRYYLQIDKERLLRFDQEFKQMDHEDDRAYYTLDITFHNWLVEIANNHRLSAFYAGVLRSQYRFSMYTARLGTAVKGDYYTEHHEIIKALMAEDADRIIKTSIAHANYSEEIALRTIQQTGLSTDSTFD